MKTTVYAHSGWPFTKRSGRPMGRSLTSESLTRIVSPLGTIRENDENYTCLCSPLRGLFRLRRPTSPEQKTAPTHTDTQVTVVSTRSPSPDRPVGAALSPISSAPKKLALLIGISYKTDPSQATLTGTHQNVREMQALLVETYHYDPANITVMLDSETESPLHPTRKNILSQIDILVSAGSPGDHFFFLYCGHTEQLQNVNHTEEDGMDECLVPLPSGKDKQATFIRDNVLKMKLVDALPKRSQLIAIFDSCCSASLLDLDHFRCNRVYVPWLNKGRRRSNLIWNRIVRKNAMDSPPEESSTKKIDLTNDNSHLRPMQKQRQERYRQARGRGSKQRLMTLGLPYKYTPPVPPTASKQKSSPLPSPSHLRTSVPKHDLPISSATPLPYASGSGETTPPLIYDSPLPVWACDGHCDPDDLSLDAAASQTDDDMPLVLAFGACKDDQVSWEDTNGSSMSTALVDILSKNANPTLAELMSLLSMKMHSSALERHLEWKGYKQRLKEWIAKGGKQKPEVVLQMDIDNFQDPQLSSIRRLDMKQRFTP